MPRVTPVNELASGDTLKAEIAYLEMRLRALSRRVHASEATRDPQTDPAPPLRIESIRETITSAFEPQADGRIANVSPRSGRDADPPAGVPHTDEAGMPSPGIDVGTLRLSVGGPHGSRIAVTPDADATAHPNAARGVARATATGSSDVRPAVDRRPAALAAVESARSGGAQVVWIDAPPGAGATTLLNLLEAAERARSGKADVIRVTGGVSPVSDIIQLLAHRLAGAAPIARPRFIDAAAIARDFGERAALVLLDRTHLTAGDLTAIGALFPRLRFVAVRSGERAARDESPAATPIVLGPLAPEATLALLTECYGRTIADDNRDVALALCATSGSLPGSTRLIAAAAREMGRSFIAVRARFDRGDAVIAAFVRGRSNAERRILRALSLAGGPLSAEAIVAIVATEAPTGSEVDGALNPDASGETEPVTAVLERLVRCELVRPTGDGRFALPGELATLETTLAQAADGQLLERIADLCSSDVPAWTDPAALDRWCATAQRVIRSLADRRQWAALLRLGPLVADRVAVSGALGAWGRVLDATATAATHAQDRSALDRVRHEFGVRSAMLGEPALAVTLLRLAARGRANAGDRAGAEASDAVAAIVESGVLDGTVAVHASLRGVPLDPAVLRESPPTNHGGARVRTRSLRGSILHRRPAERETGPPARATPRSVPQPNAEPAISDAAFVEDARLFGGSGRPTVMLLVLLAIVGIAAFAILHREHPGATPAISRLTLTPADIPRGSAVQLCADVSDAAVVDVFPDAGRMGGNGRNCRTVRPVVTTTYVAVATAADGRQVRSAATVTVRDDVESLRIASFAARPSRIRVGGSTRLCYAVSGARLLRIVPGVGDLTRLQACRTLALHEPHPYTFSLVATGRDGRIVMRQARIDVVPARTARTLNAHDAAALGRTRQAVYQFDATPSVVRRGQVTSLCVGVDRPARAFVTHIGRLQPGITRCYRVKPRTTTVYRLYVTLAHTTAVERVTVAVQPSNRRRDVATSLGRR